MVWYGITFVKVSLEHTQSRDGEGFLLLGCMAKACVKIVLLTNTGMNSVDLRC